MTNITALVSVQGISLDGNTFSIQRDSAEWQDWFAIAPEGSKFRFEWLSSHLHRNTYTAYRRKRYWEAQKRVDGKLRNATIKPEDCTYQKLEQMGMRLVAYNWESKSGKEGDYQTSSDEAFQTTEEITQLRAEIGRLRQRESHLLDQLGFVKSQIVCEAQEQVKQLEARVAELDNANWECEKRLTTYSELHRKSELARQELQSLVAEYQTKAEAPAAITKFQEQIDALTQELKRQKELSKGLQADVVEEVSKGLKAATILHEALKLKPNAGGAIKAKIKQALLLIDDI